MTYNRDRYLLEREKRLATAKAKRDAETPEARDARRTYQREWARVNKAQVEHDRKIKYAQNRDAILAKARQLRRAAGVKEKVRLPPLPQEVDRPWRLWKNKKQGPLARLWQKIRKRARDAGLPYDRAIEKLHFPEKCPVLGIPLLRGKNETRAGWPSVDRAIPEKGYVPGNVHVISFRANTIKGNATSAELYAVAAYAEACELSA